MYFNELKMPFKVQTTIYRLCVGFASSGDYVGSQSIILISPPGTHYADKRGLS